MLETRLKLLHSSGIAQENNDSVEVMEWPINMGMHGFRRRTLIGGGGSNNWATYLCNSCRV